MSEAETAPYGSWRSPITADLIVKGSIGLSQVQIAGNDVYWIEARPSESGRQVIVRQTSDGKRSDINPPGFNARTRVHEYGGGDYAVQDGAVYFSNYADQQLYKQQGDSTPQLLTKDCPDDRLRYADAVIDQSRKRLICVCEDHREAGRSEKLCRRNSPR